MTNYDLVMGLHSHVRTYPNPNPNTGNDWTTGERMADFMRQYRKATAVLNLIDVPAAAVPTLAEIDETKIELGM